MHILLVDDDKVQVRKYFRFLLSLGHKVEPVSDSELARELLSINIGAYDAIVTDMQMPHLTGIDLIKYLESLNHSVPVLLHSNETTYLDGKNDIDLEKISEMFPFVTFCLKQLDMEPTYIKYFLDRLKKGPSV